MTTGTPIIVNQVIQGDESSLKEQAPRPLNDDHDGIGNHVGWRDASDGATPSDDDDIGSFDNDEPNSSDDDNPDALAITDDQPVNKNPKLEGWSAPYQRTFRKLLKLSNGAITQPMAKYIKKWLPGTRLIFVMGSSGTGKTTMLRELTGMDLKVGDTIYSGTINYQVCPAIIDGQQYVFVDTAGFGAADLSSQDNFRDIMSCLHVFRRIATVAGVMLFYGSPNTRMFQDSLRTIRWIECFCGPSFYQNITIITSQWDRYSPKELKKCYKKLGHLERQDEIKRILNPPERYHGGTMYHHGFPHGQYSDDYSSILDVDEHAAERGDAMRDFIRRHYGEVRPAKLQVIDELDAGVPLMETQAGLVLRSHVVKTEILIENNASRLVSACKQFVHVSEPVPQAETGAKLVKTGKPAETGPQFTKTEKPQKTFLQRVGEWFVIAQNVARFFSDARESQYESSNREGAPKPPTWSPFQALQSWWNSWWKK